MEVNYLKVFLYWKKYIKKRGASSKEHWIKKVFSERDPDLVFDTSKAEYAETIKIDPDFLENIRKKYETSVCDYMGTWNSIPREEKTSP